MKFVVSRSVITIYFWGRALEQEQRDQKILSHFNFFCLMVTAWRKPLDVEYKQGNT